MMPMRGIAIALFGLAIGRITAYATTPPCPSVTATITVCADNLTLDSADVFLDGHLVDESATCTGGGHTRYPDVGDDPVVLHVAGNRVCSDVAGLRPGAWVHRMRGVVPDSVQEQA